MVLYFRNWPIASFRCGPEFDRYRGIADMAGLAGDPIPSRMVESRCGAVVVGRTYLLPPLSCGGALVVRP
jgi:hypothetical protein